MEQVLGLIPKDGAWSILAVLLLLIFGSQQIFSEEGAKKFWLFGRLARRVESRKKRSIEREAEIERTRADYLEGLIRDLRTDLDDERVRSRESEARLRRDLDAAWGYVAWTTEWSRQVVQMAAQHGWRPPLPAWLSPDEWRNSHRRDLT